MVTILFLFHVNTSVPELAMVGVRTDVKTLTFSALGRCCGNQLVSLSAFSFLFLCFAFFLDMIIFSPLRRIMFTYEISP